MVEQHALSDGDTLQIDDALHATRIRGIRLVHPTSKRPVTGKLLTHGDALTSSELVDVEAVMSGRPPGSVEFSIGNQRISQEREVKPPSPWLAALLANNYWTPPNGAFTLTVQAWSGKAYDGTLLDRLEIDLHGP